MDRRPRIVRKPEIRLSIRLLRKANGSVPVDGDYNAAKNIGMELLTVPEGERPSGLGDGQLVLKSGTVNANGGYTPADDSSADRASTGKPTTSVVGR